MVKLTPEIKLTQRSDVLSVTLYGERGAALVTSDKSEAGTAFSEPVTESSALQRQARREITVLSGVVSRRESIVEMPVGCALRKPKSHGHGVRLKTLRGRVLLMR